MATATTTCCLLLSRMTSAGSSFGCTSLLICCWLLAPFCFCPAAVPVTSRTVATCAEWFLFSNASTDHNFDQMLQRKASCCAEQGKWWRKWVLGRCCCRICWTKSFWRMGHCRELWCLDKVGGQCVQCSRNDSVLLQFFCAIEND